MKPKASTPVFRPWLAIILLAVIVSSLATGLAFAGWVDHGAEIFLAYAASGLAWCF